MPITDCEHHGESWTVEMCEHLHAELEQGIYLSFHTLPLYTIRLCDVCWATHDVASLLARARVDPDEVKANRAQTSGLASIAPDHVFEAAILERDHPDVLAAIVRTYGLVNATSRCRCVGCIDQIELEHARRLGGELPFEPFENTFVDSDDPRIQALRTVVLDAMDPRGNHGNRFFGCRIHTGTVKRPLTLQIYGVRTKPERTAMLARIAAFFEPFDQTERLVRFFEPMSWTTTEIDGELQRHRLDDVLLDEVLIR